MIAQVFYAFLQSVTKTLGTVSPGDIETAVAFTKEQNLSEESFHEILVDCIQWTLQEFKDGAKQEAIHNVKVVVMGRSNLDLNVISDGRTFSMSPDEKSLQVKLGQGMLSGIEYRIGGNFFSLNFAHSED